MLSRCEGSVTAFAARQEADDFIQQAKQQCLFAFLQTLVTVRL